MNCYVCDKLKAQRPAVAICPSCSVGLCAQHLHAADVSRTNAGSWGSCGHLGAKLQAR